LVDNQRVSVRSWIAREIVSNSLVHRDYSSTFPAKIIVEQDRIYAENWNRSNLHGRIDPDNFMPQPKNPILARFFVNIGRADKLGSGVRNLYKYTKIYSGGEPELIEGDVFKTIVPLTSSKTQMTDMTDKTTDMTDKLTLTEKEFWNKLLPYIKEHEWIDNATARELTEKSQASAKRYLAKLAELNLLEMSGANKGRRYRLNR
jgi:ATP-dependent DNA helicase RecG